MAKGFASWFWAFVAAGAVDDAAAALGVASTGASTPGHTTPDRDDVAERVFGCVAVWADSAWHCDAASGAVKAGPWLRGAKLARGSPGINEIGHP